MKTSIIRISGKVYKVGFRYYVKQIAERFNITGTVRYGRDGSVIIEMAENESAVNLFISYCWIGCPGSEVNAISLYESTGIQRDSFDIINDENEIIIDNINH